MREKDRVDGTVGNVTGRSVELSFGVAILGGGHHTPAEERLDVSSAKFDEGRESRLV